mmetsp:Transcript_11243/g.18921  ORF Transcript_11243/g.18921 Transcript_11243/m.18921 type:complete len:212 (+) Transcript_11243:1584-2219(+)
MLIRLDVADGVENHPELLVLLGLVLILNLGVELVGVLHPVVELVPREVLEGLHALQLPALHKIDLLRSLGHVDHVHHPIPFLARASNGGQLHDLPRDCIQLEEDGAFLGGCAQFVERLLEKLEVAIAVEQDGVPCGFGVVEGGVLDEELQILACHLDHVVLEHHALDELLAALHISRNLLLGEEGAAGDLALGVVDELPHVSVGGESHLAG